MHVFVTGGSGLTGPLLSSLSLLPRAKRSSAWRGLTTDSLKIPGATLTPPYRSQTSRTRPEHRPTETELTEHVHAAMEISLAGHAHGKLLLLP